MTALILKEKLLQQNSRIINVSCHAYLSAKITIDDPLNLGKFAPAFHARDAFSHSKLAVVMASRELSDTLKSEYYFIGHNNLKTFPLINCVNVSL